RFPTVVSPLSQAGNPPRAGNIFRRKCTDSSAKSHVTSYAAEVCGHGADTQPAADTDGQRGLHESRMNTGGYLAAPQGFEPRYADPESAYRDITADTRNESLAFLP